MIRFINHAKYAAQFKWLIAMMFMVLFLSGCTVQLAYNNLDRLVLRWIDQKVELNADQSRLVREALNENLDWHCREHLPQYVGLLESLNTDLQDGQVDKERLYELGDQIAAFGRELIEVSVPIAVQLMASLSDDQVQQLSESFEQSNQDLIDRLSEPDQADVQAERADRMEQRLKRFMGRLTDDQRTRIDEWASAYQETEGHQLAYAYQWQAALGDALDVRDDNPQLFAERIEILFDAGRGWDDGYRSAVEFNQALSWAMLSDVLALSNDRQRQRLSRKLRSYAGDFDALSCQNDTQLALADGA